MATMANTNSKGMYSWWWNSHITPKNSKWLKENLTDMDTKVSQMIKLIEEDADSFARRAEMYYKKRPELMKLVEEFYRAYRALAERYDHATVVLRQAQRSMAEAFPNQVPMMFPDDSQSGFGTDSDPRTPEMPPPMRALFEPDELQKEAVGLSSHGGMKFGAFTGDSDVLTSRKGLRQLNNLFSSGEAKNSLKFVEGRARKGLNFHDMDERGQNSPDDGSADLKARLSSESERVGKAESEILSLKKALARLEDEKAAGLLQYHQSLERLSDLEKETARAQGDSRDLTERAIKAEVEIQTLKDALTQLEAEREASLLQYQQSMEKISKLENDISHALKYSEELNERSSNAETEALVLKQDLARVEAEKEAYLLQYQQSLETISNLEENLRHAEEIARRITERAEKAESEIETLKQAISKLNEEKDAAAVQYNQCLEKIFSLEQKIASAEEHALRLNMEIDNGVAKLKDSEERCRLMESSNQSLHAELESMMLKMGTQSEDLAEKQKELGMLWTSVQEERLRFEEAETAFQTLQHLHSQSQEELRSLALALQNRSQILKDIEAHKQDLENELLNVKDENKSLNELNLSSSMTIEKLQDESLSLRETVQKLEAEVELRVDQRNALQQEIYCLKEEVNDLNKRHQAMIGEVESVGLKPDSFGSSVKELQDENAMLKEASDKHREEKLALLEKMEILKDLIEKNAVLENSLADLNAELEGMRGKAKSLEESCHTLLEEKSSLATEKDAVISQLHSANEALEELSEKNKFLENSLSDANAELEGLRVNLKSLEHSCMLLGDEKSNLIMEREGLVSELDVSQKMMKDSENRYMELEEKYLTLEKEIESKHFEVEELHNSLAASKQEQTSFAQLSGTRLAAMEVQIHSLQEENDCKKKLFEEELDKTVSAEMEIFILQRCIEDQEDKNFSLSRECREHLEACKLSEKRISELELENCEKQVKMKTVLDQIRTLRMSIFQVLKTLGVDASDDGEDNTERDSMYHSNILCRLTEMQNSLVKALEENQRSVVENTVLISLLGQLKLDAENLEAEKNSIHQELRVQSEQFTSLQCRAQELLTVNEELSSKVIAGGQREVVLGTEMEDLHGKLSDLQRVYQDLLDENLKVLDDKKSLTKEVFDLCEEKRSLEEEISFLFSELLYQSSIAHVFKHIMIENFEEVKKLSDDLGKLSCLNCGLEENVRVIESKLEDTQKENSLLKDSLQNLENELISVKSVCEQLNLQVASGEELLFQKENALLEAEQMLGVSQDERMGLQKIVEDLKKKYEEVSMTRENQENQIMKLSEDLDHQRKETENLGETNQELDAELLKLRKELEKTKHAEDILSGELQKGRREIELWETQACALFCELQISVVHETLLEGKLFELNKKCEDLEIRSTSKAIEAEQMLRDSQDERMELQKIAEDLKKMYEDVSMTRENQENQIMKLSEDLVYQRKETENLEETNQRLDADLLKLQEELEKTKHAEDILSSELQKGRNEIELWETQACALIGELQISVVHEALFEGKLFELNKRCEDLEISSTSKAMEVDELKEKISTLEGENGGLKAQVAAYVPAVDSLRDSITSLEKSILVHAKHPAGDNQEVKDANVSHEDLSVSDGFYDIQNMEVRIKSIEKTLMEIEQLAMLEKLDADSRLEDARRQIEDLKSVNHSDRASAPPTHKPTSEITEEKDLAMTKDIMLDQVSESSSYGVSRRGTSEVDDNKMLELWESDFKLDKVQRGVTTPIKKHEGRNLSSESLVKEVGVDKTAEPPQEGSKKKILERLDSDVQKLTNLQTTVQDLKKTVETAEKSKKGKGLELDTLKGQLEEAEEDIKKLFDVNRKLVSHAEDGSLAFNASFSFDRKSMSEFDGTKSRRRRTVSQQAQSVSEKIGRLQLEVQKLQFLLLKFDEKQSRGKTKPTESKTRVLLRDYLYGGRKTSSTQKKKKSPFCSCVQPPTKGD